MTVRSLFFGRLTTYTIFAIFVVEIASFLGFLYPPVNTAFFLFLAVAALVLSLVRLQYGVLIVFAEIVIGSKGYLFSETISGFAISLRLALFLAVFTAFVIHVLRSRRIFFFQLPYWKWWAAFLVVVALGTINGFVNGNAPIYIFKDVNAYLFFGFFPVAIQAIRSRQELQSLLQVMTGGLLAMGAKTVLVLFLFSHNFVSFLPIVYRWIRVTGVGEITKMDWNFYRVFFQSQFIDLAFVFILGVIVLLECKKEKFKTYLKGEKWRELRPLLFLFFIVFLTTFVSWSRSFWVAFVVTGGALLLWLILSQKYRFREIGIVLVGFATLLFTTTLAISVVLNIPIDGSGWGDASLFRLAADRASDIESEPAASSRMNLLAPLGEKILRHPLIGSGFGTTVTYTTQDARALANNPDGQYTTFAFEWGYLDILTEIGVLGLAIFALFGWKMYQYGIAIQRTAFGIERSLIIGTLFGLTALLGVHAVTPYLNHPIGIALIILSAVTVSVFSSSSPRHGAHFS